MPTPETMQAMRLHEAGQHLVLESIPVPAPRVGEVLVQVSACGVCRTDLHIIDGDLNAAKYPLIPGHEIVGRVVEIGHSVEDLDLHARVGIPWLGHTCGECTYCKGGRENLCDRAGFTGYTVDGGYAEYCLADARYCFELPETFGDLVAAPLLCAGLIGYRSLCKAGSARLLGIMGFGAAAHIVTQIAVFQEREVFAFTRPGDGAAQNFAREMGATWAGGSDKMPPSELDAVIIFAPVGALVPTALAMLCKGGRVVCGGIHMSDIPTFPYDILWGERQIVSVANLTRDDAREFFALAARVPVRSHVKPYALRNANKALDDLRAGRLEGAAVITVE